MPSLRVVALVVAVASLLTAGAVLAGTAGTEEVELDVTGVRCSGEPDGDGGTRPVCSGLVRPPAGAGEPTEIAVPDSAASSGRVRVLVDGDGRVRRAGTLDGTRAAAVTAAGVGGLAIVVAVGAGRRRPTAGPSATDATRR